MAAAIKDLARSIAPAPIATLDDRLTDAETAATLRFAAAAKSENTHAAYASDWKHFAAWCAARGAAPLPCPPGLLCGYLSGLAERGRKAATISRHAAAVAYVHRAGGLPPPTTSEAVRATLHGIRRSIGTAPAKKAPATADVVAAMMRACPPTLIGLRDRAMFAIGLAGAFRRSELLALTLADIEPVPEGLCITVRRSKTDQTGKGQTVSVPHGARIRPLEALRAWLGASGIVSGPLFRPVRLGDRLGDGPLSDDAMVAAIKRRAKAAGFDPAEFAGHSLRSGFMTSASRTGATLVKMMEVSRHRSHASALGYIQDRDAFRDHAGAGFL